MLKKSKLYVNDINKDFKIENNYVPKKASLLITKILIAPKSQSTAKTF